MIDEFNTPPRLAARLVEVADQLCQGEPRTIADFAVGTGELLAAAKQRWPNATFFGCDISRNRVASLAQVRTDWTLAQCNFLENSSRHSLSDLENIKAKVDLAVLNPPFSARGGTRVEVHLNGLKMRCSPAMAFVLIASQYLSPDGSLVALLPAGASHADRDQDARIALNQLGEFRAIREETAKFPGVSLKVIIAYLKRGPATLNNKTQIEPFLSASGPTIGLLRGTLQTHNLPNVEMGESIALVHSTELQDYRLRESQRQVPLGTRSIAGPAVLIHRVGRPRQEKIAYVPQGPPFATTDCIVALLCHDESECLQLHSSLTEQFSLLKRNYIGSGAPYITIKRILQVLQTLGFAAEVYNWDEYLREAK